MVSLWANNIMCALQSCFSRGRLLVTPWTVVRHAALKSPWGFSRQEYWSGFPCPPPGDLPNPGIDPVSLKSPALAGRFFTISVTWETLCFPLEHHNLQLETMLEEKRQWQKSLLPPHLHFSDQRATFNTAWFACPGPFRSLGWLLAMHYGCQIGQDSR